MIWRFAWRNAWRNPRRTGIVIVAVAVGIAGCLLAMAMNYGMVTQMVDTAIATELGHLQVHARGFDANPEIEVCLADGGRAAVDVISAIPEVRAWAPRVRGQGLVNSPRASVGVRVVAVEPEREPRVSLLADSIVAGSWFDGEARRVLMGEALARRLKVELGDKVVLSVQDLSGDLTAQAYRVGGVFRTPSLELDQGALFLRIGEAQALFGLGESVSEIVVVATRSRAVPGLRRSLESDLGPEVEVRSWDELQPVLAYMKDSFDAMSWYVYGAIFVAMAFGIANVLLMAVYERTREIGMLMAIGMSRRRVVGTVIVESLLVTLLGLAIGMGLALASVAALSDGIDLSAFTEGLNAYGIGTRIVPVLRFHDFQIPLVVATAVAVLASLWPALRAARTRPADALRHV